MNADQSLRSKSKLLERAIIDYWVEQRKEIFILFLQNV